MNRIYLDKLCEFTQSTYGNYDLINKNYNLENIINKTKQNISLNEKSSYLKHEFVELKNLVNDFKYDSMVLINPISWNLEENNSTSWYNFLNGLLSILNDNFINESNLQKKKILETADKMFRTKINFKNELNEKIIENICMLTNVNIVIINKFVKIYGLKNKKANKFVLIYNCGINLDEYYAIINWTKKYFEPDSEYVEYLKSLAKITNNELSNIKLEKIHNDNNDNDDKVNEIEYDLNSSNCKDSYKELDADENYALCMSEAIEQTTIDKKIIKKNKKIFIQIEKENDNIQNKQSSVFKKTELIDNNCIDEIIKLVKQSMSLEQMQLYALKLGISIFEGSTKSGKPKNKTKSELYVEIKNFKK